MNRPAQRTGAHGGISGEGAPTFWRKRDNAIIAAGDKITQTIRSASRRDNRLLTMAAPPPCASGETS